MSDKKSTSIQTILIMVVACVLVFDIVTRDRGDNRRDEDDVVVVSDEVKEIRRALGEQDRSDNALVLYHVFEELATILEKEPVGDTTTGKSLFDTVNNIGFYRSLLAGRNAELQSYVSGELKDMPKAASKLSAADKQLYVAKFKEMAVNFKKAAE